MDLQTKMAQLTQIYWKWSPSKFCSTLEINLYITIRILEISFRNSVSSLLSTHYRPIRFIQTFNPAQKSIGTPKVYRDSIIKRAGCLL